MKKILLLSAGSSCRAIIAKSILKKYINKDLGIDFIAVGVERDIDINANAKKILIEEGIDISKLSSEVFEDVEDFDFDLILTICSHSKEVSPKFPRCVPTIHMEFSIIDKEDESTYRELAYKIKTKVKSIILKSIL